MTGPEGTPPAFAPKEVLTSVAAVSSVARLRVRKIYPMQFGDRKRFVSWRGCPLEPMGPAHGSDAPGGRYARVVRAHGIRAGNRESASRRRHPARFPDRLRR